MAQRTPQMSDVAMPGDTSPTANARPVLVTNRPVLTNDPMMVSSNTSTPTIPTAPMTRSARTIQPINEGVVPDADNAPADSDNTDTQPPAPLATDSTPIAAELPVELPEEVKVAEEETPVARAEDTRINPLSENAEELAAEAASARDEELEGLIESGTYAVPINAASRRRSHMYIVLFCIFGFLLALVLLDVLLDAGLVSLPSAIPHTTFFSNAL